MAGADNRENGSRSTLFARDSVGALYFDIPCPSFASYRPTDAPRDRGVRGRALLLLSSRAVLRVQAGRLRVAGTRWPLTTWGGRDIHARRPAQTGMRGTGIARLRRRDAQRVPVESSHSPNAVGRAGHLISCPPSVQRRPPRCHAMHERSSGTSTHSDRRVSYSLVSFRMAIAGITPIADLIDPTRRPGRRRCLGAVAICRGAPPPVRRRCATSSPA